MKRPFILTINLVITLVMTATILAVSATGESSDASFSIPSPSPTPKKAKKPGKVNADLSGDDDIVGATPTTETQATPGKANRTADLSNKTGKAGKTPKANTINAGDNGQESVTGATRNQSTSGSANRTGAPPDNSGVGVSGKPKSTKNNGPTTPDPSAPGGRNSQPTSDQSRAKRTREIETGYDCSITFDAVPQMTTSAKSLLGVTINRTVPTGTSNSEYQTYELVREVISPSNYTEADISDNLEGSSQFEFAGNDRSKHLQLTLAQSRPGVFTVNFSVRRRSMGQLVKCGSPAKTKISVR